jgi:hypothetical protein
VHPFGFARAAAEALHANIWFDSRSACPASRGPDRGHGGRACGRARACACARIPEPVRPGSAEIDARHARCTVQSVS